MELAAQAGISSRSVARIELLGPERESTGNHSVKTAG
jgi:hypothetical protein